MEIKNFMDIMNLTSRLKDNTRHSWSPKGKKESVAEHSWRLTIMAYFTKDEFTNVDNDKVIKMCLLHDMGEAFTGDIPSFYKTEKDENKEEKILLNWVSTLPSPYNKELYSLYDEMIKQETEESKVYKALDKLEASISHNEAPISTWIDIEYKLNPVYGYEECQFNPYLKKLQNKVKEIALDKIENEGKYSKNNQINSLNFN